jgi:hypothetical protein
MAQPDPNTTFAGYAALLLIGGIIAIPQIGAAGLIAASVAIYSGACFMRGYNEQPVKRRKKK